MTIEVSHSESPSTPVWLRFLPRWSLITAIIYASLFLGVIFLVIPASENSPLPAEYFELIAAGRAPMVYRSVIALDVAVYLGLAGLFAGFAVAQQPHYHLRSQLLVLAGAATIIGFFGACLRISETPRLAAAFLETSGIAHESVVRDYSRVLEIINVSFSAVGIVEGIALLLISSGRRAFPSIPLWLWVTLGLTGLLSIIKGGAELALGADLGPLALVSGILLIVSLISLAWQLWPARTV